ncbi:MAG TPA: shikimate dehydrogenase [Parachlamydiaceae bacterium]|nr:shikimate dehydrogenase [Parachlamydiaceae bacterium]
MICIVIKGPSFQEAREQISKAMECADVVELRLDGFESLDLAALQKLRSQFRISMIFTLRSKIQGGSYIQSEENRLADILSLMQLKPEFVDLENHIPLQFIDEIASQYPESKIIFSCHNFRETPSDLEGLYREMKKTPAHFYKIALMANRCCDALRLIDWMKQADDGKLIAISMGGHGQIGRILAPKMGCPITYACLDEDQKTAPGQLSARTLIERFHYYSINPRTALFGLIGNPIDQSIGDQTHNAIMKDYGLEAVYMKMQVTPLELAPFMEYARSLPFCGISVTMPLKEAVIPFLDVLDPHAAAIGAVNTLVFKQGKILGYNTDGTGALNAIESKCLVRDKRIIIIGAGGAAKAIAYEALRRGALVTIVNRNKQKARMAGELLKCAYKGLDEMSACAEAGYDILINCTPDPLPISVDDILPEAIVMDITTKPKETLLLKYAMEKGCVIIYGYEMFVEQALGQFDLWFNGQIDRDECRYNLKNMAEVLVSNSKIHSKVLKKHPRMGMSASSPG